MSRNTARITRPPGRKNTNKERAKRVISELKLFLTDTAMIIECFQIMCLGTILSQFFFGKVLAIKIHYYPG